MWRCTVVDIYLTATFTDTEVNNLVCNTQISKNLAYIFQYTEKGSEI